MDTFKSSKVLSPISLPTVEYMSNGKNSKSLELTHIPELNAIHFGINSADVTTGVTDKDLTTFVEDSRKALKSFVSRTGSGLMNLDPEQINTTVNYFKNNTTEDYEIDINYSSKSNPTKMKQLQIKGLRNYGSLLNGSFHSKEGTLVKQLKRFDKFVGLENNNFYKEEEGMITVNFGALNKEQREQLIFYLDSTQNKHSVLNLFYNENDELRETIALKEITSNDSLSHFIKENAKGSEITRQEVLKLSVEHNKAYKEAMTELNHFQDSWTNLNLSACKNDMTMDCIGKLEGIQNIKATLKKHGLNDDDESVLHAITVSSHKICSDNLNSTACEDVTKLTKALSNVVEKDMIDVLGDYAVKTFTTIYNGLELYSKFRSLHNQSEQIKAYNKRTASEEREMDKNRKMAVANAMRRRKALNL
jgi:hypothetical protein